MRRRRGWTRTPAAISRMAYGYVRVSKEEQENSPEWQRRTIRAYYDARLEGTYTWAGTSATRASAEECRCLNARQALA